MSARNDSPVISTFAHARKISEVSSTLSSVPELPQPRLLHYQQTHILQSHDPLSQDSEVEPLQHLLLQPQCCIPACFQYFLRPYNHFSEFSVDLEVSTAR